MSFEAGFNEWYACMDNKDPVGAANANFNVPKPKKDVQPARPLPPSLKRPNISRGAMSFGATESVKQRKMLASEPGNKVPLDQGKNEVITMQHRLRSRLPFWRTATQSILVLAWISSGFDLRWRPETGPPNSANFPNHPSVYEHTTWVSGAVAELLAASSIQIASKMPWIVSPLGLAPKKGADGFRLILDLRFLNQHIVIPQFKYEDLSSIPTFLQPNDYMITLDLSKGYCHVDMHADFWTYLGFEWQGVFYVYTSLPFGLAPACWAFSKITRELISRWRRLGHRCSGFIDDSIHAGQVKEGLEHFVKNTVIADLTAAGFIINTKKSPLVAVQIKKYLGMLIDSIKGCMWVPIERLEIVRSLIHEATSRAVQCPRKLLEVITGNLISMHWAFGRIARLMTMHIYADLNSNPEAKYVKLSCDSLDDLNFWVYGFDRFNGSRPIWRPAGHDITIFTDAAGKSLHAFGGWAGWTADAAIFSEDVAKTSTKIRIAQGIWNEAEGSESSTKMELKAILHVVQSLNSDKSLAGKRVLIKSDNQGVFFIINKAGSRKPSIHTICKELLWYCIHSRIEVYASWIPRDLNTFADFYSKLNDSADWKLNPVIFNWLQSQWGMFDIDLFASYVNSQLPRYYSFFWTPTAHGVNAFNFSWGRSSFSQCWSYPPFNLIAKVIKHGEASLARMCLICPLTPSAIWWHTLTRDGETFRSFVRACFVLQKIPNMLLSGKSGYKKGQSPRWKLMALLLDFAPHMGMGIAIPDMD